MELSTAGYIIPAAFIFDLVLGDPTRLPHPIRWLGRAITVGEPFFRNLRLKLSVSGALFCHIPYRNLDPDLCADENRRIHSSPGQGRY